MSFIMNMKNIHIRSYPMSGIAESSTITPRVKNRHHDDGRTNRYAVPSEFFLVVLYKHGAHPDPTNTARASNDVD